MNIAGTIGQQGIGLIIAGLSGMAYWKNRFATLRSVGIFVGILLIGLTGWLIHVIARIMMFAGLLTSKLGSLLFGVGGIAVSALIVALMLHHLLDGWHPKGTAKKSHFWVAAALAILIVASATPFTVLNQFPATMRQGITTSQG